MRNNVESQPVNLEPLEELRMKFSASFISDLHFAPFFFKAARCLAGVPADRYSLQEWNGAVVYVLKNVDLCTDSLAAQQKFAKAVYGRKTQI